MRSTTKLSAFCSKLIEAGWLAAVLLIPLYFNVYSSRVFEPDKLTLLRSIALVMVAAWIVKWIDELGGGKRPLHISWRTPLVLPTLVVVGVYLFTTLTSVTIRVSLWGSYQRLQGTYTTLSYIVVFLLILNEMRRREQFDRLITVAIIGSVPIALYGMVQHYGWDPLPWGGDVTRRVASNMGNAIFVAAYLIMVFFLTLGRVVESLIALLTDEKVRWAEGGILEGLIALLTDPDVYRAAAYIFVAAIQLITIYFSQSRGPWVGLAFGLFAFVLFGLLSLRRASTEKAGLSRRDVSQALGSVAGLALVGALLGLVLILFGQAAGVVEGVSASTLRVAGLVIGATIGGAVLTLLLVPVQRTWKWLWLSWVVAAFLVIGFFVLFNLPDSPLAPLRDVPYIGRLGTVFQTEEGTGKVRSLIWEGAVDMITPHEPLQYPPDERGEPFKTDKLNVLRPLIGYGPESMYVAYNPFYPPDLAHYEKRNASPDRSHNETFDALVITGGIGLVAYMFLFGSVFYYGLKWLGWINNSRERKVWLALFLTGGVLGSIILMMWQGANFFGVGLPFGMTFGLIAYLVVYAIFFYDPESAPLDTRRLIVLLALVSAILAHFVEIHFGIAIAATRTHFWAYAALLVILGAGLLTEESEAAAETQPEAQAEQAPKSSRRKRRRRSRRSRSEPKYPGGQISWPDWLTPVLIYTVIIVLIVGTLGFDFVTNSGRKAPEADCGGRLLQGCWVGKAWEIVQHDLTVLPARGRKRPEDVDSMMTLGLFAITLTIGAVITLTEMVRRGVFKKRPEDWAPASVLMISLMLVLVVVVLLFVADRHLQMQRLQANVAAPIQIAEGEECDQFCQLQLTIERVLNMSGYLADVMVAFYTFVFLFILLIAFVLLLKRRLPVLWARPWGVIALIPISVLVIVLIYQTNVKVIQADILYKQGEEFGRRKEWDVAIAHHKQALQMAPNEDFYYLWLGSAYLERAKLSQTGYQILSDNPSISSVLNLSIGDTAKLSREDLMNCARAVLNQARVVNPLNTDHTANLGRLYKNWADLSPSSAEKQERIQGSIDYYNQALALSPHNTLIWNELATVYLYQLGDLQRAREIIDGSLSLDREFEQTYMILGDSYNREADTLRRRINQLNQQLKEAEEGEEADLRAQIDDLDTQRQIAMQRAIDAYRQAIEVKPKKTNLYVVVAGFYEQLGWLDDAVAIYQEAIEANPRAHDIYAAWAQFYQRQGDQEQAIDAYRQAIELRPKKTEYRLQLADLLNKLGRTDEALVEVQQAAQHNPNDPMMRRNLAIMYQQLGMDAEALQEAKVAAQLNPKDATAFLLIGDLSRKVGDLGESVAAYEQALNIDPDMSRGWTVYQNLALIYQQLGQMERALEAALQAHELAPDQQKAVLEQLIEQLQGAVSNPQ